MEKKKPGKGKKSEKASQPIDASVEDSKDGDKNIAELDSDGLHFTKFKDWLEGELEIGDIVLNRSFFEAKEDAIRSCYIELSHKTESPKATICIFHSLSQGSDLFLEQSMQFAQNGYKVHLVDFERDASYLLQKVDPQLPLFIYSHSLG